MTAWFAQNLWAQWVFSGLGTAFVIGVGGWMFKRLFERRKKPPKQKQEGQDAAQQVQVGEARDLTVHFGTQENDPPSTIQRATPEDVKKYDLRTRQIIETVELNDVELSKSLKAVAPEIKVSFTIQLPDLSSNNKSFPPLKI